MKILRPGRKFEMCASGVNVTGEVINMPESGDPTDFICQDCLCDTEKSVVSEIIQYGLIEDKHWACVRCDRCHKMHVVQYELEHWAYGVIE